MKDLIRKGLDAYEGRQERRDEEMAKVLIRHVDALSHRPTLKIYISVLAGIEILLWAAVLIRPFDVMTAFKKVADVDDKLVAFFLAAVWGLGLWLTYSLFRLKFPDLEKVQQDDGLMSAFSAQENSVRKVRIWVLSVAGGVLNLIALAVVEGLLVSN